MNEVRNGKDNDEVDLVFYNVTQAFDSLTKKHTILDVYETGVKNNAINILDEMNKKAKIRDKTPVGTSEEKNIEDIVMQGESISSIMSSTTIDKMAKDCPLEPPKYKDVVDVPQMSFVDDVININKCGKKT